MVFVDKSCNDGTTKHLPKNLGKLLLCAVNFRFIHIGKTVYGKENAFRILGYFPLFALPPCPALRLHFMSYGVYDFSCVNCL